MKQLGSVLLSMTFKKIWEWQINDDHKIHAKKIILLDEQMFKFWINNCFWTGKYRISVQVFLKKLSYWLHQLIIVLTVLGSKKIPPLILGSTPNLKNTRNSGSEIICSKNAHIRDCWWIKCQLSLVSLNFPTNTHTIICWGLIFSHKGL